MGTLTHIEKFKIEKLLGMGSGYVADFCNRNFQEIVMETCGIDIYTEKYAEKGESKANRLRVFWEKESNCHIGKILKAIIEYSIERKKLSEVEIDEKYLYLSKECLTIADRLIADTPIENTDVIQGNGRDRSFDLLAKSIREAIDKNEPEVALDRLHTYVVKYTRQLCDKHLIGYSKDEALHAVFGKYVKHLEAQKQLESLMGIRILKTAISLLDSFNDVRNNRSFAHDNQILGYHESVLIFNSITNALRFIETVEENLREADKTVDAKTDWSELPF